VVWAEVFTVTRDFAINAVKADLYAGTDDYVDFPGTAIFDNFRIE
jgi:hypothetical protein